MTYADMFSKVKGMMMEADVSTVNEHLVSGILLKSHICRELNDIIYRLQHMP